jgi:hypothetical protein
MKNIEEVMQDACQTRNDNLGGSAPATGKGFVSMLRVHRSENMNGLRGRLFKLLWAALAVMTLVAVSVVALPSTRAWAATYTEYVGPGGANTWTNYTDAGGTEGAHINQGVPIQMACWVTGFKVADGNTYWYQIASSPWNDDYYVSADAFYNNGATSGSLANTPWVDPNVPECGGGGAANETVGPGGANTWTDYQDAGGTEGQHIGSYQTVSIACRLTGFAVADGNTWWYLVASPPWDSQFYVSADAFYNDGATSGSLIGTPFVDYAIPVCSGTSSTTSGGGNGVSETSGPGGANTWTDYEDAGGTEGQHIAAYQTVSIACKLTGFAVADGNTWWYEVASSPGTTRSMCLRTRFTTNPELPQGVWPTPRSSTPTSRRVRAEIRAALVRRPLDPAARTLGPTTPMPGPNRDLPCRRARRSTSRAGSLVLQSPMGTHGGI